MFMIVDYAALLVAQGFPKNVFWSATWPMELPFSRAQSEVSYNNLNCSLFLKVDCSLLIRLRFKMRSLVLLLAPLAMAATMGSNKVDDDDDDALVMIVKKRPQPCAGTRN